MFGQRVRYLRPSRRALRRNLVALAIALFAAGAVALMEAGQAAAVYQGSGLFGPLYAIDAAAQDLIMAARLPQAYVQRPNADQVRVAPDPRSLIDIIAIDDNTIAELGAYNGGYPRSYHARVVEQLLTAAPRVIIFDVGFFETTPDDAELAAAFDHARRVGTRIVLATVGLVPQGQIDRSADGDLLLDSGLSPVADLGDANELAFANVLPDSRGSIRSMPLLARLGDVERPTLGLAAMTAYLRRPQPYDGRPDPRTVQVAGRTVPVDATSSIVINYFGPPSDASQPASTFHVLSFVDVLRGRVDPSEWQNRIVFVGVLGATGLGDDYWTPVSNQGHKMAGVEIHANVAATLFSTQFLRVAPLPGQAALSLALVASIGLLAANLSVLAASVAALGVLTAYVAACVGAVFAFGVILPVASPLLGGIATFVGVNAYRVIVEQRQSRGLQGALAALVPEIAEQIAREPERIHLGSQRRVLTVLFADLQGFTPFAERSDPDRLSRVVAEFMEAMTAAIFAQGGTVDKFIGDAVMAMWNAPLDDDEHAAHACAAALAMQVALDELSDRWQANGLPRQRMRIGIHTGPASVGNMGTPRRFAYTAIGDTVNVAARLEPLNATYGSRICVSEATLTAAGGSARWVVRLLDRVVVKGRSTPVVLYELLGYADDEALAKRLSPLLDAYNRAMALYQVREFGAAEQAFRLALSASESNGTARDGPSAAYVARCAAFVSSPPGPDWDGTYVMQPG